MTQTLYFTTRIVGYTDKAPADWRVWGPYLKIGETVTGYEKYNLTDDPTVTWGYDYWEMTVDTVTFERPSDYYTAKITLEGQSGPEEFLKWSSVSVDDNFVIPSQFDTTGLPGPFRISPTGGTLGFSAYGVDLTSVTTGGKVTFPGISKLITSAKDTVSESFGTWGDKYFGQGFSTALKNVDAAAKAVFDIRTNGFNVLQFGMEHFNDPNVATLYAAEQSAFMNQSLDRLYQALGETTIFPADPQLEKRIDDTIGGMRMLMNLANGTRTDLGNLKAEISFEIGPLTVNLSTGMNVFIDGNQGTTINCSTGTDYIFAGAGNDVINSGNALSPDIIYAGSGDDVVSIKQVPYTKTSNLGYADGGSGNDTLDLRGSWANKVSLFGGTAQVTNGTTIYGTYTAINFENVITDAGNDTVTGTDSANVISTGILDDVVIAGGGDDRIDGGSGQNFIDGGSGADVITGAGGVALGGAGNDKIALTGQPAYTSFQQSPIPFTSFDTAMPIDAAFSVKNDANIDRSVTNVTAQLRLSGNNDDIYIMFSVLKPGTVVFDIDQPSTKFLDTLLYLFDDAGSLLDVNNDGPVDPGSEPYSAGASESYDSFLTYTFTQPGTYYLLITDMFAGRIPPTWSFTLNVSMADPVTNYFDGSFVKTTVYGGDGDDTLLVGSSLTGQLLNGGRGNDMASFENVAVPVTADLSDFKLVYQGPNGPVVNYIVDIEGLIGTALNDTLKGNAGDNVLDGRAGTDNMFGGWGNDTYYVDNPGDQVIETPAVVAPGSPDLGGFDLIVSEISFTLPNCIELLQLTGTDAINGTGNDLDNTLIGNAAANILTGGKGFDTYFVDNPGDSVIEKVGEGNDTVKSTASFTLAAGSEVETIQLTGTSAINATGNDLPNILVGNDGANALAGLGGMDRLTGGKGADTMTGGTGDDTYYVDNVGDKAIEKFNEGSDIVYSSVSFNLAGTFVERLVLTGTNAIGATGNSQINTLIGNDAANTLTGLGGADILDGGKGADTALGGAGDDSYYVDDAGDKATELAGEGEDVVFCSVSYSLAGTYIETLVLTGTTAINATGNSEINNLIGNDAANILAGLGGKDVLIGGKGADTMTGGTGDDTYYVDNAGDKAIEKFNEGSDIVYSSVSFNLAGTFVEKLVLTGTTAINATGNSQINNLIGNDGANALSGLGGADVLDGGKGADTLNGGAAADTFAFTTALAPTNIDTISDFSVLDDTIQLARAIFTGLAAGLLDPGAFFIGAAAHAAADRIIYNDATGALLFDADGLDGNAAIQFATLSAGLALTNADFMVV